jgi:hypothetical protein
VRRRPLVAGLLVVALTAAGIGVVAWTQPRLLAGVRAQLGDWGSPDASLGLDDSVVRIDAANEGRAISPLIYGVAFGDPGYVRSLGATVNRWGGNASSRFDWVNGHAWNSARDWEFRNNNGGRSGMATDTFIASSLAAGAQPLITIPTLGWVARDDNNANRSLGVPADGGPPLAAGSQAIAGYDPQANRARTSLPSLPRKPGPFQDPPPAGQAAVYQDEWVHHMVAKFGSGVRLFAMDNEPDLWATTHTDVHPVRPGYQELLDEFTAYADAVKAADPSGRILGPDVSGWSGYLYSGLDRGGDNFQTHADRLAHGNEPFLQWWLHQVAAHDAKAGRRTLDYLDVHYYPQAPNVGGRASDPATQALRIRSVHSLYDPTYVDESWIGQPVALIPRLQGWVDQEYPGTAIAITEYNWGGEQDASGAVALAEVLGVYGRSGVAIANYWPFPPKDSPAAAAFRLYRNFDGNGATFGDRELPVASGPRDVAVFASRHAGTGEVDVVLANESQSDAATPRLELTSGGSYTADEFSIAPGSGQIEHHALDSATAPLRLAPLSVALVRLVKR